MRPLEGHIIRLNARELTIDLRKHASHEELDLISQDLQRATGLKRLRLVIDRPISILKHLASLQELTLFDMSDNYTDSNDEPVIHLNAVQKVGIYMTGASPTGKLLTNLRFPSAQLVEVFCKDLGRNTSEQAYDNWIKCFTHSMCIQQARLHIGVHEMMQLPDSFTGSVSHVVFCPANESYDAHTLSGPFPYLDSITLFSERGTCSEQASNAGRKIKMSNPAVEVSYFGRIRDYFQCAEQFDCSCLQHAQKRPVVV